MKEPKFKVGSKVYHQSVGKYAKVISVFQNEEGWRYIIRHSYWDWSVPEWALSPMKGRSSEAPKTGGKSGTETRVNLAYRPPKTPNGTNAPRSLKQRQIR